MRGDRYPKPPSPPRSQSAPVAISFDFFNTLATHRNGRGRGGLVMDYFRAHGWESDPWEHAVLYDVFAAHGHEFAPTMRDDELRAFAGRIARALFSRLRVATDPVAADAHALELWRILGPDHLVPFDDTAKALTDLRAAGYRLGVISNWQHGLAAFCDALGFGGELEFVVASAEVGAAKPDGRIFTDACRRFALPPERIVHVGDSAGDDIKGAREAGLQALLLRRDLDGVPPSGVVRSLAEVAAPLLARRTR
jgi:HAD superfamily hydrolase (TIGR01549 family)